MSELAIAVGIGIAFGFALERAGLGDARKLAGQFYFTDFTVLKVMFSAIVTAMLGVYWLSRAGAIDLASLYVPETYLLPQLAGGAIFGLGFVLAGLCPGTSCVAAATGRGDGAFVMFGMFAGVLGTGLAFPSIQRFYESTPRGSLTLPQLLGVPYGVVVLGVVIVALIAFALVTARPAGAMRRVLAAVAIVAGLLAATPHREPQEITATELATWIRNHKEGLRIVDVRSDDDYATLHVPRSERVPLESVKAETLVVIANGKSGVPADAYVLRGGIQSWIDEIMNPAKSTELTEYFGGVPRGRSKPATATMVRRRGC